MISVASYVVAEGDEAHIDRGEVVAIKSGHIIETAARCPGWLNGFRTRRSRSQTVFILLPSPRMSMCK
jgi:hypothetical protein